MRKTMLGVATALLVAAASPAVAGDRGWHGNVGGWHGGGWHGGGWHGGGWHGGGWHGGWHGHNLSTADLLPTAISATEVGSVRASHSD